MIDWFPDEGWQRLFSHDEVAVFMVAFTVIYIGLWLAVCWWLNRRER